MVEDETLSKTTKTTQEYDSHVSCLVSDDFDSLNWGFFLPRLIRNTNVLYGSELVGSDKQIYTDRTV